MLFRTVADISETTGVDIKRWDFSEPQSGKSACDRNANRLKLNVRRMTDMGGNCRTAEEFAHCITMVDYPQLKGGLNGDITVLGDVADERDHQDTYSIRGIRKFNNFWFNSTGLIAWKASSIGEGEYYDYSLWGEAKYNSLFTPATNKDGEQQLWYEDRHQSSLSPDQVRPWQFYRAIKENMSPQDARKLDQAELVDFQAFQAELRQEENEEPATTAVPSRKRRNLDLNQPQPTTTAAPYRHWYDLFRLGLRPEDQYYNIPTTPQPPWTRYSINNFDGYSFRNYNVKGDGNCLFRAISLALFNTEHRHMEVRVAAVAWLRDNAALLEHYLLNPDGGAAKV